MSAGMILAPVQVTGDTPELLRRAGDRGLHSVSLRSLSRLLRAGGNVRYVSVAITTWASASVTIMTRIMITRTMIPRRRVRVKTFTSFQKMLGSGIKKQKVAVILNVLHRKETEVASHRICINTLFSISPCQVIYCYPMLSTLLYKILEL